MFTFTNKKFYKKPAKNYFNDLYFTSITNSNKKIILKKPNFYVEEILENDVSDTMSNNSDIENNIQNALTTYNNVKYCIFCTSATFILLIAAKFFHFNNSQ